jgi:replicative DNA helicase
MAIERLPESLEAERAILGVVFLNPDALADIASELAPEDFARTSHRVTYEGMLALAQKGEPIDVVTLSAQLEADGTLAAAGGHSGLATLDANVPSTGNVSSYVKKVRETSLRRRLIQAHLAGIQAARDPKRPIDEVVHEAEASILAVGTSRTNDHDIAPVGAVVREVFAEMSQNYERQTEITGLATGFDELDRDDDRVPGGELIVVAGAPAWGRPPGRWPARRTSSSS